jgi:hypothetical protein
VPIKRYRPKGRSNKAPGSKRPDLTIPTGPATREQLEQLRDKLIVRAEEMLLDPKIKASGMLVCLKILRDFAPGVPAVEQHAAAKADVRKAKATTAAALMPTMLPFAGDDTDEPFK